MSVMLGIRYLIEGALPKAIYEFQQSVNLNPNSVTAHYLLAVGQLQTEHFEEAERELHIALGIDPQYQRARIQLVLCYIAQEKYQLALELFTKSITSSTSLPQESYAHEIFLKMVRTLQHKLPQARCPHEVYNSLGIVCFLMGHNAEAQNHWRQSLEINPNQLGMVEVLNRFTPENGNYRSKIIKSISPTKETHNHLARRKIK